MVKMTDLAALTNAITDIIVEVTDRELNRIGLRKGFYNSKANISYEEFLEMISSKKSVSVPGGSPANVIHGASALSLETALLGTVGNDNYGQEYIKDLEKSNIKPLLNIAEGPSGLCYVLVTPDGEKTSTAKMGVAGRYDFDLGQLKQAKIFHTSGYELMTNPERTMETTDYAKKIGAKISFDLADPNAVERERKNMEELLDNIDILFATEHEARELTGHGLNKSLDYLSETCTVVAIKKGKHGSVVKQGEESYNIPICDVKVVNTNGAGDAYAAGFLFGYSRGFPLKECGHVGSYFASRVCAIKESHL